MKLKSTTAAPLLILCVYILVLICKAVDIYTISGNDSIYLTISIMQLLVFLIPAVLYTKNRSNELKGRLRFRLPSIEHTLLIISGALVMVFASMYFSVTNNSSTPNFTLYNLELSLTGTSSSTGSIIYIILAYAVIPAICEEYIFRSILCAEYEKNGVLCAVITSSLLFAMLHFNSTFFLLYLFCGLILALVMYATRSILASITIHFIYNVFNILLQAYILPFIHSLSSVRFLMEFIILTLLMLSFFFLLSEASRIYKVYGNNNEKSDYVVPKKQKSIEKLSEALLSPLFLSCAILFVIIIFSR